MLSCLDQDRGLTEWLPCKDKGQGAEDIDERVVEMVDLTVPGREGCKDKRGLSGGRNTFFSPTSSVLSWN